MDSKRHGRRAGPFVSRADLEERAKKWKKIMTNNTGLIFFGCDIDYSCRQVSVLKATRIPFSFMDVDFKSFYIISFGLVFPFDEKKYLYKDELQRK